MASKAKRRIKLECTSPTCKRINYFPNKSKGIKDRLQLIKYCRHCRKHVEHKETK